MIQGLRPHARSYRRHASAGLDLHAALRASAGAALGSTVGGVLAYELAVLCFAVAGRRRAPDVGDDEFTYHRAGSYVPLAAIERFDASLQAARSEA